jgi:endonuclease/exonuclease/phosphatase family metal-dependent hydrolase
VVAPVAATDRRNYGRSGSRWAREHTGTDFSASCGTPVVAATAGTVRVDTSASWAGRWLVKVETGPASLTTWYAHMQALDVTDGQTVRAGQQLGEVGAEGNATGCHLHFEVHPRNGSIYADGVDPTRWLARKVGRASSVGTLPASWSTIAGGDSFALATFNIRGASHTGAASADRRIVHAVDVIARHRVDVIGLQEAQGRQVRAFDKLTGGAFARWGSGDNQVAWRRAAFTLADGVATRLVRVPYFGGHGRDMPAVRLVDRAGRASWFLSVHNPSSKTHRGNQDRWRREALAIELRAVRQLAGYGDPVYLVGDMNEKAEFGRRARAAGMVSATSWAYRGIDWITGSPGTRFSRTVVDDSRQVDAATDHPIVVTRAAAADDTIMGGFRP